VRDIVICKTTCIFWYWAIVDGAETKDGYPLPRNCNCPKWWARRCCKKYAIFEVVRRTQPRWRFTSPKRCISMICNSNFTVQNCSNRFFEPISSNWALSDHPLRTIWSKMIDFGQFWLKMIRNWSQMVEKQLKVVENVHKWLKSDRNWSKIVEEL
jgi:hypothetical protein